MRRSRFKPGRRVSTFWGEWHWTQPVGHPQRDAAHPRWRVRQWARGKTEADRRAYRAHQAAPGRLVKSIFHGLLHRNVL